MIGRPDLDGFQPGGLYRHDDTDAVLEYVGPACMPELDGEDVGVFKFIDDAGALVATQMGYDHGETFTPLGDAMADDIDLEGGP